MATRTNTITWPADDIIHRIHESKYPGDSFNPGFGDARFSPIEDATGAKIPTMYGGDGFECAAMESVYHEIPFAPGFKTHDKQKFKGQTYSQLKPQRDLLLIDLGSISLKRLGLRRPQLIDTEALWYVETRKWAEAIHAQRPDVDGLCWSSRQHDFAKAVILFGDRIPAGTLVPCAPSQDLLATPSIYSDLVSLAQKLDVLLVDGKK